MSSASADGREQEEDRVTGSISIFSWFIISLNNVWIKSNISIYIGQLSSSCLPAATTDCTVYCTVTLSVYNT